MLSHARRASAAARRGFTLVEVIVSIILIAMLTAVVVPTIRGRIREGFSSTVVQELSDLTMAINAYRQDVGKYPPQIDYLNVLATGATDVCANTLSTLQTNNFRGPYINRPITALGYAIGSSSATVNDVLNVVRNTAVYAGGPNIDVLQIFVDGVDSTTSQDVDLKVDGVSDQNYGTIKWQAQGTLTRLTYQIPIRKGTC